MGQTNYLIDTNTVIDYLANRIPIKGMGFMDSIINDIPNISIVTKIELLGFNTAQEHSLLLAGFVSDASVLALTDEVADICIALRRAHKIKLPDAIIAATAIAYDMSLLTRNVSDFKGIKDLEVINPHEV